MKHITAVLAILAAAISLCGCATTQNATTAVVEQLAVEYATGKVVEVGKTTDERTTRAKNIHQIAAAVDAVAHGDATTIAQLEADASAKIASLQLQPSDALLASGLVTAIVGELQGKVSAGVLSQNDLLVLDKVLGWVEQACAVYGG